MWMLGLSPSQAGSEPSAMKQQQPGAAGGLWWAHPPLWELPALPSWGS